MGLLSLMHLNMGVFGVRYEFIFYRNALAVEDRLVIISTTTAKNCFEVETWS